MRINKFVAAASGLSRRAADRAILEDRVMINDTAARLGDEVNQTDQIFLDSKAISLPAKTVTIMLNKPAGYVCSRRGQGSRTIYDLLPPEYQGLKPVGRLDKDSSGLIMLTNDGQLAQELTHPSYAKAKVYEIELDKPLEPLHQQMINDRGVQLDDGPSRLNLEKLSHDGRRWQVTMSEGRNRQIRRTFAALGYAITHLNRTHLGPYKLDSLPGGQYNYLS